MDKSLRVALVAFIVGLTMLLHTPTVFAEQALTEVTCADPDGNQQTFSIGWDNSNSFFEGKGDIPRLYCEGGFAQPYTTYISDTLPADSPLRYYAGIVPTPEPSPSQTTTSEPTPLPSLEPSPTPTLEPSPIPTPEPTLEPTPTPTQPSLDPVEPTALPSSQSPEPQPTPEPTPLPEQTPAPTASTLPLSAPIDPSPTPSVNAQEVALEVPTQLLAIPGMAELAKSVEAIMNIGSDMTPEQREESQAVVVGAVLVGQIAASIRKVK